MEPQEKIKNYEEQIADLNDFISQQDEKDAFGNMRIVEAKSKIKDYQARIERLKVRIAGESLCEITDEQIALADYVNSDAYDND